MASFSEFSNRAVEELTKYDNLVQTTSFGASEKWSDIWNKAHESLVGKYGLPAFYLYEDGFSQGDASDEETEKAAKALSVDIGDVFDTLDKLFVAETSEQLERLISEYENEFKNEFKEALRIKKEEEHAN